MIRCFATKYYFRLITRVSNYIVKSSNVILQKMTYQSSLDWKWPDQKKIYEKLVSSNCSIWTLVDKHALKNWVLQKFLIRSKLVMCKFQSKIDLPNVLAQFKCITYFLLFLTIQWTRASAKIKCMFSDWAVANERYLLEEIGSFSSP